MASERKPEWRDGVPWCSGEKCPAASTGQWRGICTLDPIGDMREVGNVCLPEVRAVVEQRDELQRAHDKLSTDFVACVDERDRLQADCVTLQNERAAAEALALGYEERIGKVYAAIREHKRSGFHCDDGCAHEDSALVCPCANTALYAHLPEGDGNG